MKIEMFSKIVTARTSQIVDKKINQFKTTVYGAIRDLLEVGYYPMTGAGILDEEARELLGILARNSKDQKWPRSLLESKGKQVTESLLKTFDEFTQARLAADKAEPPENKMEEEKPKKVKEVPAKMPTRSDNRASEIQEERFEE